MSTILLPADFRDEHRRIILTYILRGHAFSQAEWRLAIVAFDLLKDAAIVVPTGLLPFPEVYRQQVEERYADMFIEQLYKADRIEQISTALWATVAGKIVTDLTQAGLYQHNMPTTRLLLAFCLYWWRSFTLGYAFEIEVQRDLTTAGIQFMAHDLRQRQARLSSYDLTVAGFKGDIKTSLYFLQAARSQWLPHDFYITKVHGKTHTRTVVVFMQAAMWDKIDGDTLFVLLTEIVDTLPQAARIVHQGVELTVLDYELWKAKVKRYQVDQEKAP